MRLSTKPTPVQVEPVDQFELLCLQEGMSSAYEALFDAQKNLDEVQEVMENITASIELITKFGQAGVEQLNVGCGLEELLQIPAKLITAEKAQEGLGEAAKAAWKSLKDWIIKIFNSIKQFIISLGKKITFIFDSTKNAIAKLKNAPDDKIVEAVKNEIVNNLGGSNEGYGEYFKDFDPTCILPNDKVDGFILLCCSVIGFIEDIAMKDAVTVKTALNDAIKWKNNLENDQNHTSDETHALADLRIFNTEHTTIDKKFEDMGKVADEISKDNSCHPRSLYELGYRDKNAILKTLTTLTEARKHIEQFNERWYHEVQEIDTITEKCLAEFENANEFYKDQVPTIKTAGTYVSEVARKMSFLASAMLRVTNATRKKLEIVVDKVTNSSTRE